MKFRNNILIQYSLITFFVVVLVIVVTSWYLGTKSRDHLIRTHLDLYPNLIHHVADNSPADVEFFHDQRGGEIPDSLLEHMDMLLSVDSVFLINLRDGENTIIWSSNKESAATMPSSANALARMKDEGISYEFVQPPDGEECLLIHIPVIHDHELIGVVELHESVENLKADIQRLLWTSRMILGVSGFILYALLFSIFAGAYRRQRQITEQVKKSEQVTVYALAYQAGLRDEETGLHLKRTAEYVRILAGELAKHKGLKRYLNREYIEDLVKSAPLHDIGKVAIEDNILRKRGPLTADEYSRIKEHSEIGARLLEEALEGVSFRSFLEIAVHLVRHHHERWDGTGYPDGLAGSDIPLSARIMAVADVYDALRSKRYYKPAFSHERSVEIIRQERGRQFAPELVDAFLKCEEQFLAISEAMAD